jgi:hypothetical protein
MVVCRAIALRLSSGDNYMLAIKIFHLWFCTFITYRRSSSSWDITISGVRW